LRQNGSRGRHQAAERSLPANANFFFLLKRFICVSRFRATL